MKKENKKLRMEKSSQQESKDHNDVNQNVQQSSIPTTATSSLSSSSTSQPCGGAPPPPMATISPPVTPSCTDHQHCLVHLHPPIHHQGYPPQPLHGQLSRYLTPTLPPKVPAQPYNQSFQEIFFICLPSKHVLTYVLIPHSVSWENLLLPLSPPSPSCTTRSPSTTHIWCSGLRRNLPDAGGVLALKMKTMDARIVAGSSSGTEDTDRRTVFRIWRTGFTGNICRKIIGVQVIGIPPLPWIMYLKIEYDEGG